MANPRRTTASSSRRHGRSTAAPRPSGTASPSASTSGQHQQALWHRGACAPHLEGQGGVAQKQLTLIALWAELLATLHQGVPSIAISAEEMAGDIPGELVQPVNRELQARGCSFQVGR